MDAFLTLLIDVIFYFLGKATWLVLRTTRVPVKDLSHGGYVLLGLLTFVLLVTAPLYWGFMYV
jgi:hypothetical protein